MRTVLAAVACAAFFHAASSAAQDAGVRAAESVINFSFDQVDVQAFVKLVGEISGRQFVVADDVKGKITVVAPKIARQEVYPLFVSILESVGCSVVEEGKISRVVSLAPRAVPVAPVVGSDEAPPLLGVVTKVFRLENVRATEIQKMLAGKVGGGQTGAVAAIDETNHLLVTDTAESIRRIQKIVEEIDRPGGSRTTEVVALEFAGAEELADQLNRATADAETRAQALRRRLPAAPGSVSPGAGRAFAVASPHSNSLLLVGLAPQLTELKRIIGLMDVDAQTGRGRLNAIFLKYVSAEEAAKHITALLDKSAGKTPERSRQRRIAIEASPENNALLVDASLGDFDVVKRLVEQLDRMPEQVHIDVMIVEHSSSDDLSAGVDMAALDIPTDSGSLTLSGGSTLNDGASTLLNSVQQGMFPRGLTVGVAAGSRVTAGGETVPNIPGMINIDAVRRNSRFKVLSETSLESQNNKEASVNIVNEIPILKSTIEGGTGTSRDVIQNIERIDVGIKLKLTPHVIPGGSVRMELNPSIEAVIDPGPSSTPFAPTIAKREVSTTVTVGNGETIIIAGLTREDEKQIKKRVPFLGAIPLVGLLFQHTVEVTEKTNLLILVTPRVVTNVAAARNLRDEWTEKTGLSFDEHH